MLSPSSSPEFDTLSGCADEPLRSFAVEGPIDCVTGRFIFDTRTVNRLNNLDLVVGDLEVVGVPYSLVGSSKVARIFHVSKRISSEPVISIIRQC